MNAMKATSCVSHHVYHKICIAQSDIECNCVFTIDFVCNLAEFIMIIAFSLNTQVLCLQDRNHFIFSVAPL